MIVFERGMCRTSQRTGEMMREQKDFQQIAGSTITPKNIYTHEIYFGQRIYHQGRLGSIDFGFLT